MPDQIITIGHKEFTVACQPGEEQYLISAAEMLDAEARTLLNQIGRVPAERMLLMSGLMLADKTAEADDKLKAAQAEVASLREEISRLHSRPDPQPRRVEVPVIPADVTDALTELAARAEAVAEDLEARAKV
ncbi:cell division protein ZapA [Roseinatronobacter bogoriensis]|uniref:Cell division protein ZapA n=1 Tax=Roseinatronobacter bogoriensis subsp. barguzinensis TaxID=441209 RepID=A0A2K8KDH1_9RHOB|nr:MULTISPECIES: cell division protein ZapA [Rhodobaca]ATX65973.1 cell division protein ZapA [Rhodobaca barguzinensis]MBB4208035.1 cell division protein ZapA [Rhodobaca bogoriensis DSM 18756]TDW38675.1 cell division protein ZapA [Rhodobaca barguzinensis]TDY69287.1 cell division protein ZapA [Rhodobaca bogoriensis DSM 18756]